jgi:membrane protein implicated in regulation of membrane protease activity
MFLERSRRGPDLFLAWKVRLFFVGAALLLAGIVLDRRELALPAIVVLAAAFALRFVGPREEPPDEGEAEDGDDAQEGEAG